MILCVVHGSRTENTGQFQLIEVLDPCDSIWLNNLHGQISAHKHSHARGCQLVCFMLPTGAHLVFHLGWKFLPQRYSLENLEQIRVGWLGSYLTAGLRCVTVVVLIECSEPKNKFLASCRATTQIPHDV